MITLPAQANIPEEWIRWGDLYRFAVAMPGWGSGPGAPPTYEVVVDRETRAMACQVREGVPCPGFKFHGSCHHVRGLVWATTRPRKPRAVVGQGVADTSLSAFRDLTEADLGANQQAVLECLRRAGTPLSNRDIADRLGWSINRVTPRCLELRRAGMVVERGYGVDARSGKTVHLWGPGP